MALFFLDRKKEYKLFDNIAINSPKEVRNSRWNPKDYLSPNQQESFESSLPDRCLEALFMVMVQSMLSLAELKVAGQARPLARDIPITEYSPEKGSSKL